eukprot:UN25746
MYKNAGINNEAVKYLRLSKKINALKFEYDGKPINQLDSSFPQPDLRAVQNHINGGQPPVLGAAATSQPQPASKPVQPKVEQRKQAPRPSEPRIEKQVIKKSVDTYGPIREKYVKIIAKIQEQALTCSAESKKALKKGDKPLGQLWEQYKQTSIDDVMKLKKGLKLRCELPPVQLATRQIKESVVNENLKADELSMELVGLKNVKVGRVFFYKCIYNV